MCEGKEYDEKSDIWALGCILGEMCCRQKAFSASNLSELVKKIMAVRIVLKNWKIIRVIEKTDVFYRLTSCHFPMVTRHSSNTSYAHFSK
jgi:serine/threonine protein kinase